MSNFTLACEHAIVQAAVALHANATHVEKSFSDLTRAPASLVGIANKATDHVGSLRVFTFVEITHQRPDSFRRDHRIRIADASVDDQRQATCEVFPDLHRRSSHSRESRFVETNSGVAGGQI